jgi:hypothetical protein
MLTDPHPPGEETTLTHRVIMTDTANLGLPFIEGSQAQKHVTHNEALRILDAAIQIAVLDLTRTSPPSSPAEGERHVVASGPTGAWAGQVDAIATWQDGAWVFLAPHIGWCIWSVADDVMFVFDGTHWRDLRDLPVTMDNAVHVGINTTASSPNLLSVKSNSALLSAINVADGGSGDARLQISKESSAKTASVFFSDAFSGRAEFGLVGSDAFKLKVSFDGSSWADALSIDQSSGNITLPRGIALSGVIAPPQITANQNDYNPTGVASAAMMQLSSDAARNLSGLASGAEGRIISVVNVGAQSITLVNESASSTAANRFTLGADLTMPAKQAVILRYDGTTLRWQAISGAMGLLAATNNLSDVASKPASRANLGVRDVLSANRTYYVRTDGNDGNTGLANTSAGAFLTIQKAIDTVAGIDLAAYSVTIQVGNGTYTGLVSGKSYIGAGPVTIIGDETTPANVTISSSTAGAAMLAFDTVLGKYLVKGLKLTSSISGQHAIYALNGSSVEIQNLDFGSLTGNGWHMMASLAGHINVAGSYKISGNAGYHSAALMTGVVVAQGQTVTLTGTPAFSGGFAQASRTGIIKSAGMTYSGAATGARYFIDTNGVIHTGGGGASYFPGDSAGSASSGGQYV